MLPRRASIAPPAMRTLLPVVEAGREPTVRRRSVSKDYRRVEVAPGHTLLACRAVRTPPRDGKVRILVRHRAPMEVSEAAWNRAEVHS